MYVFFPRPIKKHKEINQNRLALVCASDQSVIKLN